MELSLALTLIGAALTMGTPAWAAPPRPQGPCDIYAVAGTACVAAHSTTRALYATYNGPLYQVKRQPDGKTLDIGIVQPGVDAGGYADTAAQDTFCADAICVISLIYDQSGKGNHLYQAPPGTFKGPAKGGFNTQPIADMAPITISGHKAYGVYIMPGMGFRNNNAVGIAIGDEAEGIYSVIDGKHYDSGCCFDYGNSSTNGRAMGPGTMETTYFGTATAWGSGNGPGPWIMADMESGLFSGRNAKQNVADPTIDSWRFVTAVVDGGGGNLWDLRGGNAQKGGLTTFYSGVRPGSPASSSYYPMHKQGAILLGTGGDNGNGSSGTFYEGVMTTGYPAETTTDAVQANIVAARYDVQQVSLSRVAAFTPNSTQQITETFTNATGSPATGVQLSLSVPVGWTAVVSSSRDRAASLLAPVAPEASISATFKVTSPAATGAGWLTGKALWTESAARGSQFEAASTRVRNVFPIKINEIGFGASSAHQFIELYNASGSAVDLSNWTLINTPSEWAPVKLATIPAGTTLASGAYYLLGLADSGLAAPASPGATTILVRSTTGFAVGQKINVDGETRTILSLGNAATAATLLFTPVSTGPQITIPAGSTNLPVTSATGFAVGQKIGIDIGGNYELATVTSVGKAATQTTLSAAAVAGSTNLKIASSANMTTGDTLTVGTGNRQELVTITSVGAASVSLAAPLHFDHMPGVDVSDAGTGISFSPATRFPHISGDAAQALGSGITLDRPLFYSHAYGAAVMNSMAATAGSQGPKTPNQWFGNVLSASAGSIALLDASGALVVDAVVYGSQQSNSSGNGTIASPELATLISEQDKGGCIVVAPNTASGENQSAGRFPDGADTDSNCADFLTQATSTLSAASASGATNIKVTSVAGFDAGQTVRIDAGADIETAVIATVGTAGATTVRVATDAGATVISVAGIAGFSEGQTIAIGSGAKAESAVIASILPWGIASITLKTPLTQAHEAGTQVSGTGINLTAALTKAHASGAQVTDNAPTPGAPNRYHKASR